MSDAQDGPHDKFIAAATQKAEEVMTDYVKGQEFQIKLDALLHQMLVTAESKARWWSAIAGGLVFAIFLILLTLQYLQVREKQTAIYEQYIKAAELIEKIKGTTATLATDVEAPKKAAEASSQEIAKLLENAKQNLDDVRMRLNTAKGELSATQSLFDQRIKQLDTSTANLAQTRSDIDREIREAVRDGTAPYDRRLRQIDEKLAALTIPPPKPTESQERPR